MKTIAVVAPFPNPHFLDIFGSPEFTAKWNVDRFCFRSLPAHRQGLGWTEASFKKLSSQYLHLPKTQKAVAGYSTVIYYGAIDPKCIPAAMMWCSLKRGQRTILVTEGIRHRHARWRSLGFSLLLNHPKLEILAIGDRSSEDFRLAGLTKPIYRKFGFFENYPADVKTDPCPEDTCRILSVGQLIDRKNFLSIVYSLQRIAEKLTQRIVYTICGEGIQRSEIESENKKLPKHIEVRLAGNCNSQQLDHHFRNADIFAMPSTYDGWGVVLNQGVHYCLPILVSSGVRAARDHLVKNNFNGFIYDNQDELDRDLTKLILDRSLRQQFATNCQLVASAWHIDSVAKNLARLISQADLEIDDPLVPLGIV